MKFNEIKDELWAGRKVRRQGWPTDHLSLTLRSNFENKIYLLKASDINSIFSSITREQWTPTLDEFEHDDWVIVRPV